jgi:phosphate uptake regulator
MQRKLIKQGGSGLVAYIPKKWIDEKGLKAGEEISFNEEAGDLLISAKSSIDKKEIELSLEKDDPLFIKIIINDLYRSGFDKMNISYRTNEQLQAINETVNEYLLGFEVTEKANGKITIENITLPEEEKQGALLRRMFFIIRDMFEIVERKMDRKDSAVDEAEIREDKRKIGQYDNYSRRNISKKKFYQESSSFYWLLYYQIYLISHSLYHLHKILRENKRLKVSKSTIELLISIKEFYKTMETGFFKQDLEGLKAINSKMNDFLYKNVMREMKISRNGESLVLYYIAEINRILYKVNSPILGILLAKKK